MDVAMTKRHADRGAIQLLLVAAILTRSSQLAAQIDRDSVLLSIPADTSLNCQILPRLRTADPAFGFLFRVGKSKVLLRDPAGQIISIGSALRQISIAFDSGGKPLFFLDQIVVDNWHQALASVSFDSVGHASGYLKDISIDSAAVTAVAIRDGPQAGLAATSRTLENTPRRMLDTVLMERAKALASNLWKRGCS
jgi:hypothetical protein